MFESGSTGEVMVRTIADLDQAVRALCSHFDTDTVVIIGSQSVLVGWPSSPVVMRTSGEIDAYPANARAWEVLRPGELASEEINALFGEASDFHHAYGFYIDGVDDETAKLPPNWHTRAVFREVLSNGSWVRAIAPSTADVIVAKLYRLFEKDRTYIEAYHSERPLDKDEIKRRFLECGHPVELSDRAFHFLDGLPNHPPFRPAMAQFDVPNYPNGTHRAFVNATGDELWIRKWDPEAALYTKADNPLGPALLRAGRSEVYALNGLAISRSEWENQIRDATIGPGT